jgi:hypothetical protein
MIRGKDFKVRRLSTFSQTWEHKDKRKLGIPRYRVWITQEGDGTLLIGGSVYKASDQPLFFKALDELLATVKQETLLGVENEGSNLFGSQPKQSRANDKKAARPVPRRNPGKINTQRPKRSV